jgi:hypothetical protein
MIAGAYHNQTPLPVSRERAARERYQAGKI